MGVCSGVGWGSGGRATNIGISRSAGVSKNFTTLVIDAMPKVVLDPKPNAIPNNFKEIKDIPFNLGPMHTAWRLHPVANWYPNKSGIYVWIFLGSA